MNLIYRKFKFILFIPEILNYIQIEALLILMMVEWEDLTGPVL